MVVLTSNFYEPINELLDDREKKVNEYLYDIFSRMIEENEYNVLYEEEREYARILNVQYFERAVGDTKNKVYLEISKSRNDIANLAQQTMEILEAQSKRLSDKAKFDRDYAKGLLWATETRAKIDTLGTSIKEKLVAGLPLHGTKYSFIDNSRDK
jgi:hypothetical protein